MKHTLLLGSQSASRQMLLRDAQISFTLIKQDADESACNWSLPLQQVVESIALYKMAHLILPNGNDGNVCFVLTADTLSQDMQGNLHGKAVDRADAIEKLKAARDGARVCTAFCLEKKVWRTGAWHTEKQIIQSVTAECDFVVPDICIDLYLEKSLGFSASNAVAIEGFGSQFLKEVRGSYSTIVGLPMYELRQALQELGFFS